MKVKQHLVTHGSSHGATPSALPDPPGPSLVQLVLFSVLAPLRLRRSRGSRIFNHVDEACVSREQGAFQQVADPIKEHTDRSSLLFFIHPSSAQHVL